MEDDVYEVLLRSLDAWAAECEEAVTVADPRAACAHLAITLRQARVGLERLRERDRGTVP